jgi:hypothetical protein
MIVTKATRHTKVCVAVVPKPASASHSIDWLAREARAQREGRDPCQCARKSGYVVDGVPMCPNHAGQAALRFLMAQARPATRPIEVFR